MLSVRSRIVGCVTLTLVMLNSNPSNALTNEDLYLACKGFAESGFKATDNPFQDALCLGYVRGVYDQSGSFCGIIRQITQEIGEENAIFQFIKKAFAIDMDKASLTAGIQKYVNDMKNKPESWAEIASGELVESLKTIAPCD